MPDTEHLNTTSAPACDRRAHARREVSSFAYLELGDKNGGVLRDIGQNGLAVQAAEPLPEGESLSVRFQLPNTGIWIHATGRVAWRGKSGRTGGIQFVDLPETAKAGIDLWISSGGKRAGGVRRRSRMSAPAQSSSTALPAHPGRTHSRGEADARDTRRPPIPSPNHSSASLEVATQATEFNVSVRDSNPPRWQYEPDAEAPRAAPADLYSELRDARYRMAPQFLPEIDRGENKPRRWGAAAAVTASVILLFVIGASMAPQDLRGNIVQQVGSFVSRYTERFANSKDVPFTGTNFGSATASVQQKGGDADRILPAHQDPVAAFPLNNSKPLELQLQQVPTIPKAAESALKKSRLNDQAAFAESVRASKEAAAVGEKNLEARPQEEKERKEAEAIPARTKRETAQSAKISPHLLPGRSPLEAVAAESTQYTSGSYSSDGFLDLPETPVSASTEFAITARRTISLRYPAEPQPGYAGQNLKIGSLVYHVDPIYPEEALRGHVQGMVELHATIAPDGNVESVEPVSGPIPLIPAAIVAVRQWQYGRTLHYGQPIPTEADIDIVFRLP